MHLDSGQMSRAQALGALRGHYPEFPAGEVWLVGAGPGDPGLLTLDGLAGLVQADVLVHDADKGDTSMARQGKGIRRTAKTCQHGIEKGWRCWQCGGIAVIA